MKNIFKTGKQGIAAILTLCILLGIAGTCVYAASAVPEENLTVTEETTQELVPVMASSCSPPTSIVEWSQHALDRMSERNLGQDYLEFVFQDAVPVWNSTHGTWNYTDGEVTICVNPVGTVTTVYWNYD